MNGIAFALVLGELLEFGCLLSCYLLRYCTPCNATRSQDQLKPSLYRTRSWTIRRHSIFTAMWGITPSVRLTKTDIRLAMAFLAFVRRRNCDGTWPNLCSGIGYHNVMVDRGTQGPTPDQTGIHGMGAGQQSTSDAYQDTVQALEKEQARNDTAGEQHTVQDPWASGHHYSDWPGSFAALGPGGTIKHELGDWLPSPWALWGALVRSIRALRDPNAAPDSLLWNPPGGSAVANTCAPTAPETEP